MLLVLSPLNIFLWDGENFSVAEAIDYPVEPFADNYFSFMTG